MVLKPGYKQTEVGVIPEDWDVVAIGVVGDVLGGRQRSPGRAGELTKYLRVANVFEGFIDTSDVLEMPFTHAEKERFLLQDSDILLNEGQSLELVGRSAIYRGLPKDCCFQNTLIRFRAGPLASPEYAQAVFQYYLHASVFAAIASQTTSVAHLGAGRFAALSMPLPPLPEQHAIANALGDADALIESLDQLIAKKRQIKQGAMQQLLTGKTRLPGFSGEWGTRRFGELFQFLKTANNSRADLSSAGDVTYVHYGDIHTSTGAFVNVECDKLPSIDSSRVAGVPLVQDGDLIMVDASEDYEGTGKCVEVRNVLDRKVVAGLHTILLRGNPALVADGFKGYLQYIPAVRASLIKLATGISVYGISKNGVKGIEVALPSPAEQHAIATMLSDMDGEIEALEARRDKAKAIKQGMMQSLLTGQVRLVEPEREGAI